MFAVTGDFQALAELRASFKGFSNNFGKETTRCFAAKLPDLYRANDKPAQPTSVRPVRAGVVEVVFELPEPKRARAQRPRKTSKTSRLPRGVVPRGWEKLAVTSAQSVIARFMGGE